MCLDIQDCLSYILRRTQNHQILAKFYKMWVPFFSEFCRVSLRIRLNRMFCQKFHGIIECPVPPRVRMLSKRKKAFSKRFSKSENPGELPEDSAFCSAVSRNSLIEEKLRCFSRFHRNNMRQASRQAGSTITPFPMEILTSAQ